MPTVRLIPALVILWSTAARAATFDSIPLSLSPLALDVAASAPATPPETIEEDPGYGVTGNWWGARDALREKHIVVGGSVLFDVSKVLRGGLDTEAWPISYLLDLHATVDMEGAFGWKGGTLFVCFQSHDQSENGDAAVGDIQVFDNISAPRFVQIAQLWYKQSLGDLRLKIGKIDANADACRPSEVSTDCFSLVEHGLDFIQSAAAFSPTIFALPSYPEGGPGLEAFYGKDFYVGVGTFYSNAHQTFLNLAGHPEKGAASNGGMFVIGEIGARWTCALGSGYAGVGGWYHGGDFPRTDGSGRNRGAGGGYAFVDQSLFHEDGDAARDIGFFFTAGIADKTTSPMDQNLMFGISASGFVPGRPDDSMGVMASWVHIPTQPGLLHPFELATELFYKFQITRWASLKPSFAYIVSPSGMQPDAAVITLRAEIDF